MADSANQQVSPQLQQFILQEQAKAQVNIAACVSLMNSIHGVASSHDLLVGMVPELTTPNPP